MIDLTVRPKNSLRALLCGAACWTGLSAFGTLAVPQAAAQAVRTNAGFRANSHFRTDDDSVNTAQPLGFTLNFFGAQYSSVFVNNNGNVTFGSPLFNFTPQGLSGVTVPMIAPFWADVDTEGTRSDVVRYGQDTVNGRRAFGVNYVNVGYFSSKDDKLNSYQVVLIDRSDTGAGDFDIEFNYDRISWESGDIESPTGNGFGGTSASAGYSNGTLAAGSFFEVPGSLAAGAFLDTNANGLIRRTQNSGGVLGRLVFVVRNGAVAPVLRLSTSTTSLSFSGLVGAPAARQTFQILTSGGSVPWSAAAQVLNGAGWLALSPASGTAVATQPSTVQVDVNFAALPGPGLYQAAITVRETGTALSLVVPVTLALGAAQSRLQLSSSTAVFRASQGGAAPPPQALRISNTGVGTLSWSIPPNLAPWLTISPLTGTASAGAAQPSLATVTVNPASLPVGVYQVLVPVSAPGTAGDSQLATVTVHVVPSGTPPLASLAPYGMIFVANAGSTIAPPPQSLRVSNAGGGSLSFTFQSSTLPSGPLVSLTPATGNTANGPVTVQVTANPAGLPPGIFRGAISGTFSSGAAQQVEVLVVVVAASALVQRELPGAAACGPQSMDLVATSVGSGLNSPVAFPQSLLAAVVDNCGGNVDNATVVVNADGQNIALQPAGAGLYNGTWTPERVISGIPVAFTAYHGTYPRVQKTFSVGAAAAPGGVTLPAITNNGVVEGAGFTPLRPLAPGGIVSIFGSQLAASEAFATALPLPRTLAGSSVRIGGESAPLYYAGPGQINAQIPYSVQPGTNVSVAVTTSGLVTAPQNYFIAPVQPGVFIGAPYAAVLDGQSRAITAENQARIGDTLQIYTTGLGATTPAATTGAAAPPFSTVTNPVTVTIGDVSVPVVYQGLAPGFVGLYQVNVVLTPDVPTGTSVSLEVRQNGIASNPNLPATIPVRAP